MSAATGYLALFTLCGAAGVIMFLTLEWLVERRTR